MKKPVYLITTFGAPGEKGALESRLGAFWLPDEVHAAFVTSMQG
jgi:hypothetical protein